MADPHPAPLNARRTNWPTPTDPAPRWVYMDRLVPPPIPAATPMTQRLDVPGHAGQLPSPRAVRPYTPAAQVLLTAHITSSVGWLGGHCLPPSPSSV